MHANIPGNPRIPSELTPLKINSWNPKMEVLVQNDFPFQSIGQSLGSSLWFLGGKYGKAVPFSGQKNTIHPPFFLSGRIPMEIPPVVTGFGQSLVGHHDLSGWAKSAPPYVHGHPHRYQGWPINRWFVPASPPESRWFFWFSWHDVFGWLHFFGGAHVAFWPNKFWHTWSLI